MIPGTLHLRLLYTDGKRRTVLTIACKTLDDLREAVEYMRGEMNPKKIDRYTTVFTPDISRQNIKSEHGVKSYTQHLHENA